MKLLLPLLALASLVCAQKASDLTPSQVHLAYHGSFGMTVSWSTHAQLPKPTVKYGLLSHLLLQTATSSQSVTYNTSTVWLNHVTLSNLVPGLRYYYKVSNSDTVYHFTTAKIAGDMTPYTAAMVADMGTFGDLGLSDHVPVANGLKPGQVTTIDRLKMDMDSYDHILHPGDLAYADYWLKEELGGYFPLDLANGSAKYEAINEAFYDELAAFTPYKPYMVAPGNHEANCDNGGTKGYTESICVEGQRNFTGYINRFRMPSDVSGGLGNFWYSFNYGMTHYIFFDTETDLGVGLTGPDELNGGANDNEGPFGVMNQQINFLKKDLASVNRFVTPWVVAMGHRPWYMAADASDLCTVCQQAFEDIFYQHGVDLVMAGHIHASNRNDPIYKGTVDPNLLNNPKAPWYVVNGAAGHYDGLDTLITPRPSYVAFANDTQYTYSKLTFHNRTHLTHDYINSATGQSMDTATLYKRH